MKQFLNIIFIFIVGLFPSIVSGQSLNKMRYSVSSYAFIEGAFLGEKDTVNLDVSDRGLFVTDLGFNIDPSKSASIDLALRITQGYRSGGIFALVDFRQLTLNGVIGNSFLYNVGDYDYQMTPYTFYVPDEEVLFSGGRWMKVTQKINRYNTQYFGNQRRMRGARVLKTFKFKKTPLMENIKAEAYFSRNRVSLNALDTLSDLLTGGGRVIINQSKKLNINLNNSNVFTIPRRDDDPIVNNNIFGSDAHLMLNSGIWQFKLSGEFASSSLSYNNDDNAPKDARLDYAMDFGFQFGTTKKTFSLSLNYMNVGPQYYNITAQSKTLDFTANPFFFPTVTNLSTNRRISLFDLSRDGNIYTPLISESLMSYDPRLANTLPYGLATPNRTGVRVNLKIQDYLERLGASVELASLKEISSLTTTNERKFLLAKVDANVTVNNILQWSKLIQVTFGGQYEKTTRDDGASSNEKINLKTLIASVSLDVELVKRFHLIGGSIFLSSEGNERLFEYDEYNNIIDFTPPNTVIDETQWLLSGGIEYRVNENTYIILNYNNFKLVDNTFIDNNSNQISHISMLLNVSL